MVVGDRGPVWTWGRALVSEYEVNVKPKTRDMKPTDRILLLATIKEASVYGEREYEASIEVVCGQFVGDSIRVRLEMHNDIVQNLYDLKINAKTKMIKLEGVSDEVRGYNVTFSAVPRALFALMYA